MLCNCNAVISVITAGSAALPCNWLEKLAGYGVVNASQTWFQSYLSNRMQSVKYGGALGSSLCCCATGVYFRPFIAFYLHQWRTYCCQTITDSYVCWWYSNVLLWHWFVGCVGTVSAGWWEGPGLDAK